MKTLIAVLALMFLAFTPVSSQAGTHGQPALYAITFHADWCGSCKILGPELKKARGKADLDNQNVLFVKLDLTSQVTRHQSALMADALGIGDFYQSNNGKTGFVLLVNSETGETLGTLTKEMKADQISAAIEEKISAL